jgi:hypothetical protein
MNCPEFPRAVTSRTIETKLQAQLFQVKLFEIRQYNDRLCLDDRASSPGGGWASPSVPHFDWLLPETIKLSRHEAWSSDSTPQATPWHNASSEV